MRKIVTITLILVVGLSWTFWSLAAKPKNPQVLNSPDANDPNAANGSNGKAVTVLVVYHTVQEHTATLAKAVAEGADEVFAEATSCI